MEVEINAAKGTRGVILTENDRDLLIQGDAMTELGSAAFVSLDGLVHQRHERSLKFFGRLIDTNKVFIVRFQGFSHFWSERFDSHGQTLEISVPKVKIKK